MKKLLKVGWFLIVASGCVTPLVAHAQTWVTRASGWSSLTASGSFTASGTGVAEFVAGGSHITLTFTQTGGALGTTVFVDVSNNPTQPNLYDPTQWVTLTNGGLLLQAGPATAAAGNVSPINQLTIVGAYYWLRVRLEGINATVVYWYMNESL